MSDQSTNQEYKLFPGGLFRCCTGTLAELAHEGKLKKEEGEEITCLHCKQTTMVFQDGAYKWNQK